jgi:hypothetical protein
MAYTAARTIFQMMLHNEALRDNLLGIPHYFHVMMSFAGHFMLDVCAKHSDQLAISISEDLNIMNATLAHCKSIPGQLRLHPLSRMTAGLMRKLAEYTTSLGMAPLLDGSSFQQLDNQGQTTTTIQQMPTTPLPDLLGPYSMPNDLDVFNNLFFPDNDPFGSQDAAEWAYLA